MFNRVARRFTESGPVLRAGRTTTLDSKPWTARLRAGRTAWIALTASILATGFARADSTADASRYSHTGFKGAITLGTLHNTSKLNLDDAPLAGLGLGYGLDQNVSLWVTLSGSEHRRAQTDIDQTLKTAVGGMDLTLQYRFLPADRVQPYGKIGIDFSSMEETDTHNAKAGAGVHVGLGADYFFSRHLGIGAEVTYRSLEYTQERTGLHGDFKEMARDLDGDAVGLVVSFTVQ
jgi:outer membrane protein W